MSENLSFTICICAISLVIGVCVSWGMAATSHPHSPGVTHITTNITNR